MRKLLAFLHVVGSLGGLSVACAAELMQVDAAPVGDGFTVRVNPSRGSAVGLLDLIDARSGRCVRTLYAGRASGIGTIAVANAEAPPAGSYRVRYREGIRLTYEGKLLPPDGGKWHNPTDLQITPLGIYVFDPGILPDEKTKTAEKPADKPDPSRFSRIYRFQADGQPAPFGGNNHLQPFARSSGHRCLAVDGEGHIYLGSLGHHVMVLDRNGQPLPRTIGGEGTNGTFFPRSFALGPERRIYVANDYLRVMQSYDSRRDGVAGFLAKTANLAAPPAMSRCLASDGEGGIYIALANGGLVRIDDEGSALEVKQAASPGVKLAKPTGPCASKGLVWVADHGPGFGPFWDSGGGGEVLLF